MLASMHKLCDKLSWCFDYFWSVPPFYLVVRTMQAISVKDPLSRVATFVMLTFVEPASMVRILAR